MQHTYASWNLYVLIPLEQRANALGLVNIIVCVGVSDCLDTVSVSTLHKGQLSKHLPLQEG